MNYHESRLRRLGLVGVSALIACGPLFLTSVPARAVDAKSLAGISMPPPNPTPVPLATTLTIVDPGPIPYGGEVTFTSVVKDSNGGTVDATTVVYSVDGQPIANPYEALLAPGTHTVTANYPGTPAYGASTATLTFTVTGTPGKVTGGGTMVAGEKNFGFVAQAKAKGGALVASGNLEFQDKTAGVNLHATAITGLAVAPDGVHAVVYGDATVNGVAGYKFVAWIEDWAEPGAGIDTFRIDIAGPGFSYVGGYGDLAVLESGGNIQVHKPKV